MQRIVQSQAAGALTRVFFTCVNAAAAAQQTRLQASDMSTFTVYLSKAGVGTIGLVAAAAPTEVSATNAKGLFYVELTAADVNTLGANTLVITNAGGTLVMEKREIVFQVVDAPATLAAQTTAQTSLTTLTGLVTVAPATATAMTAAQASLTTLTGLVTVAPATVTALAAAQTSLNTLLGFISATPATAASIFAFVMDAGAAAGNQTFAEQWRTARAVMTGNGAGMNIATAKTETYKSADGTKTAAAFTLALDGTRTATILNGTP